MELAKENIEHKKQIIIKKYGEFILKVENDFDSIIRFLNEFENDIRKRLINNLALMKLMK